MKNQRPTSAGDADVADADRPLGEASVSSPARPKILTRSAPLMLSVSFISVFICALRLSDSRRRRRSTRPTRGREDEQRQDDDGQERQRHSSESMMASSYQGDAVGDDVDERAADGLLGADDIVI